jgi:hypothetical protein
VFSLGARFDRGPQLGVDTHRHDVGRTRSHRGSTPTPRLEGLDVVVGLGDLGGDGIDLLIGQGAPATGAMGFRFGRGMSSRVCGSRS